MGDIIYIIGGVLLIVLLIIVTNIRVVPQSQAWVMERIGVYSRTWHTGLHIKFPFIESAAMKVDLREQILLCHHHPNDLNHPGVKEYAERRDKNGNQIPCNVIPSEPYLQPVITKDNVRMNVDVVVFYQITDPKLFAYGHSKPIVAINHLTSTTLRNLIGELELDATLVSRDLINTKMRTILDDATDPWGIKVTRVEIKNIDISDKELQDAMEKQMIAERVRRERIIEAEGLRKAKILVAEGEKQATILLAEGEKQKQILAAEAKREAMICEAEGEAEAILQVQQATAEGIKMVNASEPSKEVLTIKSLEAFQKAADGQATKIIIPSEIQGLAGLASSAAEIFKAD